jgi:preprotein translocase subunit SecE
VATSVRPAPTGPRGPSVAPPGRGRASIAEYFRGVWEELKKVVWPTRDELARMTGIVIATVILFAVVIGAADYLLSLGVRQVYTSTPQPTTSTQNTLPPITRPTLRPTLRPSPVPSAQATPHVTPVP